MEVWRNSYLSKKVTGKLRFLKGICEVADVKKDLQARKWARAYLAKKPPNTYLKIYCN